MTLLVLALALQAASPAAATAVAPDDKPVCKRTGTTGSFVRTRKVCLTRRQWQRVAEESQELGRSMRPALTVQPGGS